MQYPSELKYTKTHEWVKTAGQEAVCGITDYAQNEISDVVFAEAPKAGRQVKKGEAIAVVESVKAAFDIYAPVSGEVTVSNTELETNPALINQDPYGKGWFFKIRLSDPSEFAELMSSRDYERHVQGGGH